MLTSRILTELQKMPATAREMADVLKHDRKRVSAALSNLADAGCVAKDESGKVILYRFVRKAGERGCKWRS